jgi:flagellar L-ring protein precursor FlgH
MKRWALTLIVVMVATAPIGRADSIWDRRDPRYANLFQDNRARNIGDLLTIAISEVTVANEQDQRDMRKRSFADARFGFGTKGQPGQLLNGASDRSFTGNAQVTTNRVFTDRLTVTVVDMMPNGNLVFEGYRSRVVEGEERVLRITGVVRQADIQVGNVVPSAAVANFRISYLGRGPETRMTNQNYLGRLVNHLWPW